MPDDYLWRPSFRKGLHLIGRAVARLPYGAAEPILCGASAIEFYTGGLWMSADFTLLTSNSPALYAELLKEGCRWNDRRCTEGRGLWHPSLHFGVRVRDEPPSEARRRLNILTVRGPFTRLPPPDVADVTIQVIGIEDLIAEEIAGLASRYAMAGEAAERIETLVDFGRAGVGGRFRAGYLQRRLAHETKGKVVLDLLPTETRREDLSSRTMMLLEMRDAIDVWRARRGLSFGPRAPMATRTSERPLSDHARREPRNRGGPSPITSNIVYLDDLL